MSVRESRHFIEDIELPIQHRRTAAWALAVEHGARLGAADVDLGLTHLQGMSALGARRAPEEQINQGTARPRLWQGGVGAERPFAAWGTHWRHKHRLRVQHHDTRLKQHGNPQSARPHPCAGRPSQRRRSMKKHGVSSSGQRAPACEAGISR